MATYTFIGKVLKQSTRRGLAGLRIEMEKGPGFFIENKERV